MTDNPVISDRLAEPVQARLERIEAWQERMNDLWFTVPPAPPDPERLGCWTCGAPMNPDTWAGAPREPSDETLRVCRDCHYTVELSHAPLQIANMIRYAAGLPTIARVGDDAG